MQPAPAATPLLTLEWIASTLSWPAPTPRARRDESDAQSKDLRITTDSRLASPDSLFLPVQGEKIDGHAFVESAAKAGACGIILRRDVFRDEWKAQYPDTFFICVDDTLRAYRHLAQAWRARFTTPIVCVAGSAGKTTTKELLAAMLTGHFPCVLKTQGSQNGYLGIPMTLLELRPRHSVAIVEVGIDEVGAMAEHLDLIRPTHAILTAIGPEHLEKLVDLATVTREELLSLQLTHTRGGWVSRNADDPAISEGFAPGERIWSFGIDHPGEVSATLKSDGVLSVSAPGCSDFELQSPLPGRHNALNCLGAASVALQLGLTPGEISKGLSTFEGAFGRSVIEHLATSRPGGTRVLCDYYNAQPASMRAAFSLLSPGAVLCLGEMRELGAHSERLHRELAADILRIRPHSIFLLGAQMRHLADQLKKEGFAGALLYASSHEQMAEAVLGLNPPPAEILIKGSRGLTMEKVFSLLQAGV